MNNENMATYDQIILKVEFIPKAKSYMVLTIMDYYDNFLVK